MIIPVISRTAILIFCYFKPKWGVRMGSLLVRVGYFTPPILLCIAWLKVVLSGPRCEDPRWRRLMLFAALAAATVNSLSAYGLPVYEMLGGNLGNHDEQLAFELGWLIPIGVLSLLFCAVAAWLARGPSRRLLVLTSLLTTGLLLFGVVGAMI
jgi:hypothetical protein